MKLIRTAVLGLVALLGGCVVAPPAADYGYYTPAPGYYYSPAPYYYGPTVNFGLWGGRSWGGGYRHWH